MRLTKLQIEMKQYGANKGRFEGRAFFENESEASIEIPLDNSISIAVLKVCAEHVVQAGKDVAKMMVADVIEATVSNNLIENKAGEAVAAELNIDVSKGDKA